MTLASPDRLAEDVFVVPVIVAELKFGDVEGQIFSAYFVERADDPALEDAPETFNRVGVDRADNVLVRRMPDDGMRELAIQSLVANPFVCDQQADFLGHRAAHEGFEKIAAHSVDDASNDFPLALDRADDWCLTR